MVTLIFDVIILCAYVLAISCLFVAIRYVSHLQRSLRNSNEAQSNLLNGMHEGVLILDKKKLDKKDEGKNVLFANWPAQKLFIQFIGAAGLDEEDLMSKLCYQPIRENKQASFLPASSGHEKPEISLEMIIMMQLDEPNQRNCIYKLKTTE